MGKLLVYNVLKRLVCHMPARRLRSVSKQSDLFDCLLTEPLHTVEYINMRPYAHTNLGLHCSHIAQRPFFTHYETFFFFHVIRRRERSRQAYELVYAYSQLQIIRGIHIIFFLFLHKNVLWYSLEAPQ